MVLDSVLIQAFLAIMNRSVPGDFGVAEGLSFGLAMASACGAIFTMHTLMGYRAETLTNVYTLLVAGILILISGMIQSLFLPTWIAPANGAVLTKAGVLPLLGEARVFWETLGLSLAFIFLCALYTVLSQRIRRRGVKAWLTGLAFSYGQQVLMAAALLCVSVARLVTDAWPPLSGLPARLFFYAAALVALKGLEILFTLVYVELLGARRWGFSYSYNPNHAGAPQGFHGPFPSPSPRPTFATLERLIRRQHGVLPLALLLLLLLAPQLGLSLASVLQLTREARFPLALLGVALFVILVRRALWFLFPRLHPLARSLLRWGAPDQMAANFLEEYQNPVTVAGRIRATKSFLIDEGGGVTRVFYLPRLAEAREEAYASLLLRFSDGAGFRFTTTSTQLVNFTKNWAARNGGANALPPEKDWTEVHFVVWTAVILLLVYFQWYVVHYVEFLNARVFYTIIALLVSLLFFFALGLLVKKRKEKSLTRRLFPVALVAGLSLALLMTPLMDRYLEADFEINRAGREELVQRVRSGEVNLGQRNTSVALPPQYAPLSKGGSVRLRLTSTGPDLFFFLFRDSRGAFDGYAYVSEDSESSASKFTSGGRSPQVKKIAPHWYWVSQGQRPQGQGPGPDSLRRQGQGPGPNSLRRQGQGPGPNSLRRDNRLRPAAPAGRLR
jgi:hypothetical protein